MDFRVLKIEEKYILQYWSWKTKRSNWAAVYYYA